MSRRDSPSLDDPCWWYRTGFVILLIGLVLTVTGGGFGGFGGGNSGGGSSSDSGGWWDNSSGCVGVLFLLIGVIIATLGGGSAMTAVDMDTAPPQEDTSRWPTSTPSRSQRSQPKGVWTRTARHAIFGPTQLIVSPTLPQPHTLLPCLVALRVLVS